MGSDDGAELSGYGEKVGEQKEEVEVEAYTSDELRELLETAKTELEVARLNSLMYEDKAQRISEAAIALKDEAGMMLTQLLIWFEGLLMRSLLPKKLFKMERLLFDARLKVAVESIEVAKGDAGPTFSRF